jgi:hypothetical protein
MAWHGMDCSRIGNTRASAPSSPRPCPGAVAHAAASHLAARARRGAARRGLGVWFHFSTYYPGTRGKKIFRGLCSWLYLSASYPRSRNLDAPSRVVYSLPESDTLSGVQTPTNRQSRRSSRGKKRQRNSSCKYTPPRSSRRRTGHKDLHLPRSGTRNQREIVWPRRRDLARTGGPLELTAEPEEYHVAGPERW